MKIFKSSNLYLTRISKMFFLAQSLSISSLLFMLGYVSTFEMDGSPQYILFGFTTMAISIGTTIAAFNLLSNGNK